MFVTIDLFSALIDSRAGGGAALARIAGAAGHDVDGGALFDDWDARCKASQRDTVGWIPFAEHCRLALAGTWAARGWSGDVGAATEELLDSLPSWPTWPDVPAALPGCASGTGWACCPTSTTRCWPGPGSPGCWTPTTC
ncbi:hypothetical protein ACFQX8_07870 [Klenkia terrae]|uniref:hypothetical protein n=1 Tax=Klenkia terrae TaxID=1052259 RepID=UPI0036228F3A